MKNQITRLIVIIAAIATLCGITAVGAEQEYLPIVDDGKSWVLVEKRRPLYPGEKDVAYYDVSVVGDTTLGNKQCKKVSIVGRDGANSYSDILYEENGKLNRVVYIGYGIYSFVPLIDMTLEKGDKVPIQTGYDYPPEVIPDYFVEIRDSGSVTTTDGIDRKVLDVTDGYSHQSGVDGTEVWVEGIGCNGDIWLTLFPIPGNSIVIYSYIDCCMKDGEVLFTKEDFDRLLGKYNGIDKVGPTEPLTLTYSEDSVSAVCNDNRVSLELFSLDGRLIARTHSDEGKASLETSELPGGIFIAKAASGESTAVRKIVL